MHRLIPLYVIVLVPAVTADELTLNNGTTFRGTIVRADETTVTMKVGAAEMSYPAAAVKTMNMNEPSAFKDAKSAFKRGDFDTVLAKYIDGMKFTKHPVLLTHARKAMAVAYIKMGRGSAGLKEWAAVVEGDPGYASSTVGDFLQNSKSWDDAFAAALGTVTATKPETKTSLKAMLALAAIDKKDWAAAEEGLAALRADTAEHAKDVAEFIHGQLFVKHGKGKEYVKDFHARAGAISPLGRAYGFYSVGQTHLQSQQHEQAMLAFLRVGLLHPELKALAGDALYNGALILEKSDPSRAADFYKQIVRDHLSCSHWEDAKKRLSKLQ